MMGVLIVYLAGVALGLWLGDAPALKRAGLALLWPVALLACVTTLSVLLLAAAVFFPAFGAALVVAGGVAWWTLAGQG